MNPNHFQLRDLCEVVYRKHGYELGGIEFIVIDNVVCFRGTDEFRDVIRDLRILPWWRKGLGWSPAGFSRIADDIAHKLLAIMVKENIPPGALTLCGHSLGGAMAQLVAAFLVSRGIAVREVVAYGAPRCGRLKVLDNTPVTLYRNGKDIVTSLPPLMRRHKDLTRVGTPNNAIKDHFIKNYDLTTVVA